MSSSDDLFALFYEPLQRAVHTSSSSTDNDNTPDYLDDERGLAASWSEALHKM